MSRTVHCGNPDCPGHRCRLYACPGFRPAYDVLNRFPIRDWLRPCCTDSLIYPAFRPTRMTGRDGHMPSPRNRRRKVA